MLLWLSTGTSALDGYDGAVGLCIVSENAFNAGIASIPTPITDIQWDGWLWYQSFSLRTPTAGTVSLGEGPTS